VNPPFGTQYSEVGSGGYMQYTSCQIAVHQNPVFHTQTITKLYNKIFKFQQDTLKLIVLYALFGNKVLLACSFYKIFQLQIIEFSKMFIFLHEIIDTTVHHHRSFKTCKKLLF